MVFGEETKGTLGEVSGSFLKEYPQRNVALYVNNNNKSFSFNSTTDLQIKKKQTLSNKTSLIAGLSTYGDNCICNRTLAKT